MTDTLLAEPLETGSQGTDAQGSGSQESPAHTRDHEIKENGLYGRIREHG